jgi:hypothetical protein
VDIVVTEVESLRVAFPTGTVNNEACKIIRDEEKKMVAHVEFFNIDSEKERWVEGMKEILAYYKRKFPEVIKTPLMPLADYEDVSSSSVLNPPNQWIVLETFESEEAMKKARQEKFNDPEWDELMRKGRETGLKLFIFQF